jgi:hypothetical protein
MVAHVIALGCIGVVRSVLGFTLAAFLLKYADVVTTLDEAEPWDAAAFRVFGGGLLLLSVMWLVQGVAVLLGRRWGRPLGLMLSGIDLVNLAGFPVFTGLGLYALVVYRHADTVDYFATADRRRG